MALTFTFTNDSQKPVVIKIEADETVSEDTRHYDTAILPGSSLVIFTDHLKKVSVT